LRPYHTTLGPAAGFKVLTPPLVSGHICNVC